MVCSIGVTVAAQTPAGAGATPVVPTAPQSPPRVLSSRGIDGAKNPELIADDTAITIMISTWSNAYGISSRAFENVTSPVGLSGKDMKVLRDEIGRAHDRIALRTRDFAQEVERRRLCLDTFDRLIELLSQDGRRKLQAHIGDVKAHTTSPPSLVVLNDMTQFGATGGVRPAPTTTAVGRLRDVDCQSPMTLTVRTDTGTLRLRLDDPASVIVLSPNGKTADLQCGAQDVSVVVGYEPQPEASTHNGVIRVLDFRPR